MRKKKMFVYGSLGTLALALTFGITTPASAFMGEGFGQSISPQDRATMQQKMFEKEAEVLGVSVDEVKNAWAKGVSFKDLAKEKGISEADLKAKMKATAEAQFKAELQNLVSTGVITQAQADARLAFMQTRAGRFSEEKGSGHRGRGMGAMMKGFGMGMF